MKRIISHKHKNYQWVLTHYFLDDGVEALADQYSKPSRYEKVFHRRI